LVRKEIRAALKKTASSASERIQPGQQLAADLGLSSSQIVELVATLERRLGLSASESLPLTDLQTVDDLCRSCLSVRRVREVLPEASLAASQRRGQARRLLK
jgi:acyl carrier protein